MIADYHVHTDFSHDSSYPMEKAIEDAKKLGLKEICFTDHVDLSDRYGDDDLFPNGRRVSVDCPRYFKTLEDFIRNEKGITIRKGLEFGTQITTIERYNELFGKYPFDFVIMSIHWINEDGIVSYQKDHTQLEYYNWYYDNLYELVCNFHNYSVVGHLDICARYDHYGKKLPFELVKDRVERILRKVIEDGKGIEVNTSSFRYGLDDYSPTIDILKLYKELGGRIITIGSDGHRSEDLGFRIKDSQEMLKGLGFTKIYTFERMKPIEHDL